MTMTKTTELDPQHVTWCRRHFEMMADGGTWGIPRSGLVFRKEGYRLILMSMMPWMEEMEGVITPEQLHEQQEADYEANRVHFEAAGITVERDPGTLLQ